MSDQLIEKLTQDVAELTRLVSEAKTDPATLEWAVVESVFGEKIEAIAEARAKEAIRKATPIRKGQPVWAMGKDEEILSLRSNRYFKHLAAFSSGAKVFKDGNTHVKAIDLWLTNQLLQYAHDFPGQSGERTPAPSDDLAIST